MEQSRLDLEKIVRKTIAAERAGRLNIQAQALKELEQKVLPLMYHAVKGLEDNEIRSTVTVEKIELEEGGTAPGIVLKVASVDMEFRAWVDTEEDDGTLSPCIQADYTRGEGRDLFVEPGTAGGSTSIETDQMLHEFVEQVARAYTLQQSTKDAVDRLRERLSAIKDPAKGWEPRRTSE